MATAQPSPWPNNPKNLKIDPPTVNGDSTHANGKHGKVEWREALRTPVRPWTCATPLTSKNPSGKDGDKQSEAPVSAHISPDMLAIAELLCAMKRTVGAVSDTCESLGVQTAKVMDLAPAIQLSGQVGVIHLICQSMLIAPTGVSSADGSRRSMYSSEISSHRC
jgi:hypothetical protein